jgi:hypothetical protein
MHENEESTDNGLTGDSALSHYEWKKWQSGNISHAVVT